MLQPFTLDRLRLPYRGKGDHRLNSFIAGRLLGLGGKWAIAPALLVLGIGGWALFRSSGHVALASAESADANEDNESNV